jgi:hypothetical protein
VLQGEWKGKWEQHITTKALTVPIVVFVGLGSPAAVLLESATLIRQSTPGTATSFQVDPGDPGDSAFFAALKLDIGSFFKLGWCEFMESLADHLASFQSVELEGVIARHADDNALEPEDCTALVAWLREIGLIKFGLLRAKLLMGDPPYEPDTAANRPLVADLLHAIAMVQRRSGAIARLCEDGVVEFVRDGRITSAFILASGRGSRGKVAMQSKVRQTMRKLRGRHCFPQGAIIAASDWSEPISVPEDIVNEQLSASILTAQSAPTLIHVSELRANVEMINKVSP